MLPADVWLPSISSKKAILSARTWGIVSRRTTRSARRIYAWRDYRTTLAEYGLSLPDQYIKLPVFPPRDPDKQVHELLDLPNPPTAIFAATDDLALRVMKIARKRGVRIPEDLALIGFDDIDIAEYLELTTISQSLFESGKLAAEHLMAQMANPKRLIENTFIQLKLIERSTT